MKLRSLLHEVILKSPHTFRRVPPVNRDQLSPESTLFGWVLRAAREHIPCASESEAKYLAALASIGMTEIPVPDDPELVRATTKGVEEAVSALWRHVEEAVQSETDHAKRQELIDLVWEEVREKLGPLSETGQSTLRQ